MSGSHHRCGWSSRRRSLPSGAPAPPAPACGSPLRSPRRRWAGGTVEGGVKARQLVVEPSARITGDVEYESIAIETGGQVDGQLKHVSAAEAEKATAPKTGDSGEDNVRFMTKLGEAG